MSDVSHADILGRFSECCGRTIGRYGDLHSVELEILLADAWGIVEHGQLLAQAAMLCGRTLEPFAELAPVEIEALLRSIGRPPTPAAG